MVTRCEKRTFTRHHGEGEITLLHADQHMRQIEGGLINFSRQGIRFFSRRPLPPGTTIIVRASDENYRHVPAQSDCQLRSMGFCTIKWCQEVHHKGIPLHEMGAAYMIPY